MSKIVYTEEALKELSKQLVGFPVTLERGGPVIGEIIGAEFRRLNS